MRGGQRKAIRRVEYQGSRRSIGHSIFDIDRRYSRVENGILSDGEILRLVSGEAVEKRQKSTSMAIRPFGRKKHFEEATR